MWWFIMPAPATSPEIINEKLLPEDISKSGASFFSFKENIFVYFYAEQTSLCRIILEF